MLIDTHAHLDFPQFNRDREEIIARAQTQEIKKIINVGCNLETSCRSFALAEKYPQIFATVGIHPSEVKEYQADIMQKLRFLAPNKKVIAIGEAGLDYFHGDKDQGKQKEVFLAQIKLAQELNLPLIIHTREAAQDLLQILNQEKLQKFVIHCFTENLDFAQQVLDLGAMISFTGIITYPQAKNLRAVVKFAPLERIMIETDCPFLAPQKFRGERNEPAFVVEIAQKIAEIKGVSLKEVAEKTTQNAEVFFGI